MVFSSLPFLFLFLTVVLLLSHLLPFRLRNGFLLLANLVFYAYGEPVYILIMLGSGREARGAGGRCWWWALC